MTVTHNIDMDLIRPGVRPLVCGVQGEAVSRVIRFHLTENGIAYPVPKGAGAVVRFRKADGTGGIYDTLPDGSACYQISSNTVSVTLAPQVMTCPGQVELQLELRQGDQIMASFTVCLLVERDPSAGADPSEDYLNWMDATVEALGAYLKEYPLPGGSALCARNERELQKFLSEGRPVMVNSPIALTGPIIIDKDYTWLEFSPTGSLIIRGKDFPAIQILHTAEGDKPAWVRIENPRIFGGWTPDSREHSVGIQIQALGYNNHINFAEIQGCEYGIQTLGDYDCAQQNTVYEPYICNCRYGIDDRSGGLQNVRFFGGRIENNREWGLVSASINLCFNGTMIQGNDLGEVKLLNIYAKVYDRIVKSGGIFTNCYFEHIQRYDEGGRAIEDSVFQLGDETQGEGWFGQLSLVGCKIGHFGNYALRSFGRGAVLQGHPEQNLQRVQLIGCTCNGNQLFYLPNMDNGCRILMLGPTQGQTERLETDVGQNVVLQYLNNQYSRLGMTQASAISGINAPLDYAHMRQLYLEPFGYEIDEDGYPILGEDGSYISKASYGNWIEATTSALPPWAEEGTGINQGSLHYASKYTSGFKSPGWFVRTGIKGTEKDSDANWSSLITGSAKGVQDRVHGRSFLLEPEGSEYGSWLEFTHAKAKPWEYVDKDGNLLSGIMKGSLHYCAADSNWYQRTAQRTAGVDAAANWSPLVTGRMGSYGDLEYTATEGTYIEAKGYPAVMGTNAAYVTRRYAVQAGKTYGIHGTGVSFPAAYPLALFTRTTDYGDGNIGTVLLTGTTDQVDYTGEKAVTFTPQTDGYIWIATHTARKALTVQELTFGEGELMGIVLNSSTPGSDKKFILKVDDTGTLTAIPCGA